MRASLASLGGAAFAAALSLPYNVTPELVSIPEAQIFARDVCNADNCLRAVQHASVKSGFYVNPVGAADCTNVLGFPSTPVTTITVTATYSSTATAYATKTAVTKATTTVVNTITRTSTKSTTTTSVTKVATTTVQNAARDAAQIPAYASPCSGMARYASACTCLAAATTTVTITPTVTKSATFTITSTQTKTTSTTQTTTSTSISVILSSATVTTTSTAPAVVATYAVPYIRSQYWNKFADPRSGPELYFDGGPCHDPMYLYDSISGYVFDANNKILATNFNIPELMYGSYGLYMPVFVVASELIANGGSFTPWSLSQAQRNGPLVFRKDVGGDVIDLAALGNFQYVVWVVQDEGIFDDLNVSRDTWIGQACQQK